MALSPEARLYIQEVARSRIRLDHELEKLSRLVALYGEADVAQGMAKALAQRTFGARYVRALIDQSRFAAGLTEPTEPILTGNTTADSLEVQPHALESYDELVSKKSTAQPHS